MITELLMFHFFHKPTSTLRLIPSNSHSPIQHKIAPFHSLIFRLVNLPLSIKHYKEECEYIQKAATINGFNNSLIDALIKKHSDKLKKKKLSTMFDQNTKQKNERFCLTFCPKYTNQLKHTLKKQKLDIVYRAPNKIKKMLGRQHKR